MTREIAQIDPGDAAGFRSWLAGNHAVASGVWVVLWKRSTGHPSTWALLDGPESGLVPDDLAVALDRSGLRGSYEGLRPSAKKAILTSLALAKGAATRARRIERALAELGAG